MTLGERLQLAYEMVRQGNSVTVIVLATDLTKQQVEEIRKKVRG